ncbi:MAG: thiamine-phosphate kinase [Thermomicrobiales bacterium]
MDERRVSDIGEFGLIAALAAALPAEARDGLELGIGDDAAVWQPGAGAAVVITTDSLVEEIHFRLDWTDWESLGHKALAVNVSDLAAMGAAPKLAVVTLGLRGSERVGDLVALYAGMGDVARRYGVVIAGGDIVRSPHGLALHITALGELTGPLRLTRSGARPGDIIAVTGTLGASAAGLQLLLDNDEKQGAMTADLLLAAHLRPEPRVPLGAILREQGASSAMDLSDGLLGDLPKILTASNVAAEIDLRAIPVAAAVRALYPEQWLAFATRGGEDYELLFTASPDTWPALAEALSVAGGQVAAIGRILPPDDGPALSVIGLDGARRAEAPGAFDHFAAG